MAAGLENTHITLNASNWSVYRVIKWLLAYNLNFLVERFYDNEIDGDLLLSLNDEILSKDLYINDSETRSNLLFLINSLKLQTSSSSDLKLKFAIDTDCKNTSHSEDLDKSHISQIGFYSGKMVDCRDSFGNWHNSVVLLTSDEAHQVLVHYFPLNSKWDEWIPMGSDRFAPINSKVNKGDILSMLKESAFKERSELDSVKNAISKSNEIYDWKNSCKETLSKPKKDDKSKKDEKTGKLKVKNGGNEEFYVSAYTPCSLKHAVSDEQIFEFLKAALKAREYVSEELVVSLGVGRHRAIECYKDFKAKFVNGESVEPQEVTGYVSATLSEKAREKRRKRSRRTTAMLTEDWRGGNRKGLWKCPKCNVVLTAQKRYTHPCFRDNLLSIEQYNQSLRENQNYGNFEHY